MVKISIVIPVYNCVEYLEQCIKSALCQTIKELEIICIDDGSTDDSVQKIESFQREDARIRLFRQENQGAGAARNLGIRKARGKYIAFLDGDDYYWDGDALERMFHTCEANKVVVCGSLRKRMENGVVRQEELFCQVDKDTRLSYRDFQLDYDYQSFLFLKSHLTENEIFFPHYRRFQDPPFLVRALYEAAEFIIADTYLYCYRVPNMRMRFDAKKTADLLCGLIDNLVFAREHHLDILFQNTVSRLEYEYETVICKNVAAGDTAVLGLLSKANQIICGQYGREEYIIRPLRILSFDAVSYGKKLTEMIEKSDEIVLYGAGAYGQIFLSFLKKGGYSDKVKSFVVSRLEGNSSCVEGIPVRLLQKEEKAFIFVTASEKVQKQIEAYLAEKGYRDYEPVRTEFLDLAGWE